MAYEKNRRRPPVEDDGTLIEGRNAVLETLRAGRAVDKVFVAEGAHIGDVAAEARRHHVPVVTCDRRKLDGMSPTGNHQGVIAQAAAQEYVSLDDIFRVAEERSEVPLIVVCDGIEGRIIWVPSSVRQRPQAHTALSSRSAELSV